MGPPQPPSPLPPPVKPTISLEFISKIKLNHLKRMYVGVLVCIILGVFTNASKYVWTLLLDVESERKIEMN